MKNVIKHSKKGILMVTMFATLLSFANEASIFNIENDAVRTSLTLTNVKQGNLLSIKDSNGIVVYKELIQKSGIYTKDFELTSLPNGKYFLELDKGLEIKTIPFTVESSNITFNKELEKIIFKPLIKQKKGLVNISKVSPNLDSLSINIYAKTNLGLKPYYSESIEGIKIIERVYNLPKGKFLIVLNSNNREFTKFINN